MAYIEGVAPNQVILFFDVIDDYIEDDNQVQFIDAFVDSLDLVGLGFKYAEPEPAGRPPYPARRDGFIKTLYLRLLEPHLFQSELREGDPKKYRTDVAT